MTSTKIVLGGAAMCALLLTFAITRIPAPLPPPVEPAARSVPTAVLPQMPLETPTWVPDEATKKKALLKAYEITGTMNAYDGMSVYFSTHDPASIDMSQEDFTERVTAEEMIRLAIEMVDPNERNALDVQADKPAKGQGRQKLAHRGEAKPEEDICTRHGMHKVVYRDRWRCRK